MSNIKDGTAKEIEAEINKRMNIVIDWKEHDGVTVALIKRPYNKCQPFVVAWNYYHVDGTWGQGHYFSNIVDAAKFYDEEYGEKKKISCHIEVWGIDEDIDGNVSIYEGDIELADLKRETIINAIVDGGYDVGYRITSDNRDFKIENDYPELYLWYNGSCIGYITIKEGNNNV